MTAGGNHSLAVTESGALYSWGRGGQGQLGHGDEQHQHLPKRVEALQERVCSVAAGDTHSLAVTASGVIYSWGGGSYGKLGHGDYKNQLRPKRVEALQERVCSVAACGAHSLAVVEKGALYSWGKGAEVVGGVLERRRAFTSYSQGLGARCHALGLGRPG